MVNYQVDHSIAQDSAQYNVSRFSKQVDASSVLQGGPTYLEVPHPKMEAFKP